ncbi:hypothetical protein PINS_up012969 [Pythium insidiosum]|nr:hypothetical protein PINS_up012969 [Pythium insidiosum]
MSKAPKQRKAQLHYQPYQFASSYDADTDHGVDFQDLPMHLDPVLSGFSSNLSRNLWDDWNESDSTSLNKFTGIGGGDEGVNVSSMAVTTAADDFSQTNDLAHQLQLQLNQQQQRQMEMQGMTGPSHNESGHNGIASASAGASPFDPMNFGQANGMPRDDIKRSLSEDLASMLDDDVHDSFLSKTQAHPVNGFSFSPSAPNVFGGQLDSSPGATRIHQDSSSLAPRNRNDVHHPQQTSRAPSPAQHTMNQGQTQSSMLQSNSYAPQQNMMNGHSNVSWMNASGMTQSIGSSFGGGVTMPQVPQSASISPQTSARLEAQSKRPEPSPMQRLSAAIETTMVAIPNPCKESEAETVAASTAANASTPSPFNNYSMLAQATDGSMKGGDSKSKHAPNSGMLSGATGMMIPSFMMYPMPMMGNYPAAAAAAAAAMGMMPMGMQMGAMNHLQMGALNQMGVPMGPMGMPMGSPALGMQMPMGVPMGPMGALQMASMGVPLANVPPSSGAVNGSVGADLTADGSGQRPIKALQPKDASVPGRSPGFVSIARKPDEPEVSGILKTLMEEEAKKKEKKLERNRDSARESRKKQQTYVETLENGIKRLQINRDYVVSYRWGVAGPMTLPKIMSGEAFNERETSEWKDRVNIVTGKSESFSSLQNPANFETLMKVNRQKRSLSMPQDDKARAVIKCFICIGRMLSLLRARILELQVFRDMESNPLGQELREVLQLSEEQRLTLQCHSNRVFAQEVLEMVKLLKVFVVLREKALQLNVLSPSLERYFQEVCSMDQLQRLLQWSELHRTTIEQSFEKDVGSEDSAMAMAD